MPKVIEQDAPARSGPRAVPSVATLPGQAEAIAQRLAQFQETVAFLEAKASRHEGRSPTPQEMRVMTYEAALDTP